ncbi:PHD finger protein 11A isoform X1 [Fundulus heteroclitus]|uniref:PHD finger protein 11A isoform X1 n=1 Tax=Fundulus heteroclitus TaxID=8078 RepID=UPI00165C5047|nr:PHD finger protein 11A isoform X1 [Fundulus heteroclitus]
MNHGQPASCVLCCRSKETKITGTLSTKERITAHQNCLLFSSGIFCTNSPQFDDLFGFSVKDVQREVKRGAKLCCSHCRRKGATAGCELKRCKRTFHYPCAVEGGARTFEDDNYGKYGLYCMDHSDQTGSAVRRTKNPGEAGSSKKKKTNGTPSVFRQLSSCSSDTSGVSLSSTKRELSFDDLEEEGSASERKSRKWRKISEDSSPDEGLIPPLETDLEESMNSLQEHVSAVPLLISKDSENPSCSPAGIQVEDVSAVANRNEDETLIQSDAESESLLAPAAHSPELPSSPAPQPAADECLQVEWVEKEVQTIKRELEESSLDQYPDRSPEEPVSKRTAVPDPSPEHCQPVSPPPSSSFDAFVPQPVFILSSASPSPTGPPSPDPRRTPPASEQKPDVDSASFWRSCNTAGCTRAIFSEFTTEMNNISSRIQCDQASQEDYDRALSVMMASGRLADLVTKQEEELERRQMELQRASAALRDVASALRR